MYERAAALLCTAGHTSRIYALQSSFFISTTLSREHYCSGVTGRESKLLRYGGRHRRIEGGPTMSVTVLNGLPRSSDNVARTRLLPALQTESGAPPQMYPIGPTTRHPDGVMKG